MDSIIKTVKLTKNFKNMTAVNAVDLDIKEGLITGFLGPNGAGKSTTMNILMGFIGASSGEAWLNGQKVSVKNAVSRRDVGFLSNSVALDKSLTARQEVEYFGNLVGGYNQKYVDSLVKRLDLQLDQKISGLSTGNYQKVGLVVALMHQPKLLILDEPTNGLDPLVQAEFNKIILELKDQGSTIFISSHILSEVQELCDEFVFIKQGKIVAKLSRSELVNKSDEKLIISPSDNQRKMVIDFLKTNRISYTVESGNLESEFMKYYGDGDVK